MREIVEDGRRRAEVAWAKGSVRFDTDFIDGYDRRGEVTWQSGWADIARAEVKPQLIGRPVIVLTERQGRKLEVPHTPESWAAVRFLLPSSAELMLPSTGKQTNVPALLCIALGAALFLGWIAMPMSASRTTPLLPIIISLGSIASLWLGILLLTLGAGRSAFWRKGRALEQRHSAKTLWMIRHILDAESHWFLIEKEERRLMLRLISAIALGIALCACLIVLRIGLPHGALPILLGAAFILPLAINSAALLPSPPAGSRLRISNGQVHLFLPGQAEPIPIVPSSSIFGQRVGAGKTAFWLRLDSFKMIQAPEE